MSDLISRQPVAKDINVPCTDTISRQAAIDTLHEYFDGMLDTDTVCPVDIYGEFECIPSAQQWIPVTERLPKDDEEVIVSCTDDSGDTPFSYTTVAWHFKGTWICNDERCFFITAWMPLPKPYKEEK